MRRGAFHDLELFVRVDQPYFAILVDEAFGPHNVAFVVWHGEDRWQGYISTDPNPSDSVYLSSGPISELSGRFAFVHDAFHAKALMSEAWAATQ